MANETLISVFTGIGDAIRGKEKSTDVIPVLDMASRITALKDGFPNGMEWTQSNITSGDIFSVYNANGIWVAGSDSGLYYSTDGKTWTQSNITSGKIFSVYNANGIWVACSGNGLYYSTDGKAWTQSNITSGFFNFAY